MVLDLLFAARAESREKSPLTVPAWAFEGTVLPTRALTLSTAFTPSKTIANTGPDFRKSSFHFFTISPTFRGSVAPTFSIKVFALRSLLFFCFWPTGNFLFWVFGKGKTCGGTKNYR